MKNYLSGGISNICRHLSTAILLTVCTLHAGETIGVYASHSKNGRSILLKSLTGYRLRITPYGDFIVRIQTVRSGEEFFPDDRYEMVESHQWPGNFKVIENKDHFLLSNYSGKGINIRIEKNSLRCLFKQPGSGDFFLKESKGTRWNGDTISESFYYDPREHFTGLGHGYYGREDHLDLKGELLHRNYGSQHGQQSPLIVPFYLSNKGYGVFLNSTFPNTFDFGKDGKYEMSIAGNGRMDYFVILGPDFRSILDRYTQLTGRPRLLPLAAFGLGLSDKGNDQNSSDPSDENWWKRKIKEHRAAGFPIDHVINDNRWRAGGGQRCISYLDWDRTRYPDPAEYESWIRSSGLIVTLDFNRCIASHSDGWKPSFNISQPDGIDFGDSAPDLTKKVVRNWFWNLFWMKTLNPSLHFPGDALWIDEFDELGSAPLTMVLGNGRSWREMKNYWFFLVAKALVQEGWDKNFHGSKRPFVWVRGMTAGAQRYATLWSGDIKPTYDDMKTQVRSMQLAGLSGFPFWGHDAGGFNDWEGNRGPDDTMYRQWSMAFGSFSPFWKPHGMGESRWPLDRPKDVQMDAKKYTHLRYELMPYLYTYAHRAAETGIPIARAMVIDHQNDSLAWTNDLQYMWGDDFLVAPECADSGSVKVWLPKGAWFDFWNDSLYTGHQEIAYDSPTGILPLFVKRGSIVPGYNFALSTSSMRKDSLTLHVYSGKDAAFQMYEDDGVTERYQSHHEYRTTNISYSQTDLELNIAAAIGTYKGAPSQRSLKIIFHGLRWPMTSIVNGHHEDSAWNAGDKTLEVIVKSSPASSPISVRLVKKDLP